MNNVSHCLRVIPEPESCSFPVIWHWKCLRPALAHWASTGNASITRPVYPGTHSTLVSKYKTMSLKKENKQHRKCLCYTLFGRFIHSLKFFILLLRATVMAHLSSFLPHLEINPVKSSARSAELMDLYITHIQPAESAVIYISWAWENSSHTLLTGKEGRCWMGFPDIRDVLRDISSGGGSGLIYL